MTEKLFNWREAGATEQNISYIYSFTNLKCLFRGHWDGCTVQGDLDGFTIFTKGCICNVEGHAKG